MFDQSKYVCKTQLIKKPEMPLLSCISPTVEEAMRYAELRDKYDEDMVKFEKVRVQWEEEAQELNDKMKSDILNDTGWANHSSGVQEKAWNMAQKFTDQSGQQLFDFLTELVKI